MSEVSSILTEADITAFKGAYKQRFDIDLDDDTARHKLTRLVRLVELICKPEQQGAINGTQD